MSTLKYITVVLAVVCFTATESVGARMRREHVEWWNALLEDFQRQVSRAMTSCEQPQSLVNTNITREILEEIQMKSIELELEGHNKNLTLKEIQQIRSEIKHLTGRRLEVSCLVLQRDC